MIQVTYSGWMIQSDYKGCIPQYYGEAFKGARGVTQGDPLSPTIFNVVVDAVVRHWLMLAMAEAEKRGERGNGVRYQATLFYVDDGMVALSDPCWI